MKNNEIIIDNFILYINKIMNYHPLIKSYTANQELQKSSYRIHSSKLSSAESGRYLERPVKGQQLHYLYPGRLMSNQYHYTGYNIPHEDPEGLERTHRELDEVEYISDLQDQNIADYLGGGHPLGSDPLDPTLFQDTKNDEDLQEYNRLLEENHFEESSNKNNKIETNQENNNNSESLHHNEPFGFNFDLIRRHIWIWIISIIVLIPLVIGIIHEIRKK